MADKMIFLITVRRVSVVRRFWREFYTLVRWGLQHSVYGDKYSIFAAGVLGHEGFSVFGRKNADEIELKFFESMQGPLQDRWSGPQLARMRREMIQAVEEVARRHGYADVFWRERKPSPFI